MTILKHGGRQRASYRYRMRSAPGRAGGAACGSRRRRGRDQAPLKIRPAPRGRPVGPHRLGLILVVDKDTLACGGVLEDVREPGLGEVQPQERNSIVEAHIEPGEDYRARSAARDPRYRRGSRPGSRTRRRRGPASLRSRRRGRACLPSPSCGRPKRGWRSWADKRPTRRERPRRQPWTTRLRETRDPARVWRGAEHRHRGARHRRRPR